MPNRLLKETSLLSEAVNALSVPAEVFYRRLLSAVDDHGRFDGRSSILRSRLYPLQIDRVALADVEEWLAECEAVGLVRLYTVDGRRFLYYPGITGPRSKSSRYPAPPDASAPTAADWSERRQTCLVYFIVEPASRSVKIGSAICPESRLQSLQTSNPNALVLIGTKEGGSAQEKEYHRRFDAYRIRPDGEWFRLEGDLAAFLRDEGFDC